MRPTNLPVIPRGLLRRAAAFGGAVVQELARAALLAALFLASGAAAATLSPWGTYVVTSDSMAPRLQAGDVIVSEPVPTSPTSGLLVPGTVVTAPLPFAPDRTYTHRIVAVDQGDRTYTTKADASPAPDPEPVDHADVLGRTRIVLPHVGLLALWSGSGQWARVAASAAAAAALWVVAYRWQLPAGPTRADRSPQAPPDARASP